MAIPASGSRQMAEDTYEQNVVRQTLTMMMMDDDDNDDDDKKGIVLNEMSCSRLENK